MKQLTSSSLESVKPCNEAPMRLSWEKQSESSHFWRLSQRTWKRRISSCVKNEKISLQTKTSHETCIYTSKRLTSAMMRFVSTRVMQIQSRWKSCANPIWSQMKRMAGVTKIPAHSQRKNVRLDSPPADFTKFFPEFTCLSQSQNFKVKIKGDVHNEQVSELFHFQPTAFSDKGTNSWTFFEKSWFVHHTSFMNAWEAIFGKKKRCLRSKSKPRGIGLVQRPVAQSYEK